MFAVGPCLLDQDIQVLRPARVVPVSLLIPLIKVIFFADDLSYFCVSGKATALFPLLFVSVVVVGNLRFAPLM